jgi:hypothetical protein
LAFAGAVGGEAAVDRFGMFPEPGSDELAEKSFVVEDFADLGHAFHGGRSVKSGFDHVVVVALDAVEAELLVLADLGGKGDFLANRRPKGIAASTDVPGAECETIVCPLFCRCH